MCRWSDLGEGISREDAVKSLIANRCVHPQRDVLDVPTIAQHVLKHSSLAIRWHPAIALQINDSIY